MLLAINLIIARFFTFFSGSSPSYNSYLCSKSNGRFFGSQADRWVSKGIPLPSGHLYFIY